MPADDKKSDSKSRAGETSGRSTEPHSRFEAHSGTRSPSISAGDVPRLPGAEFVGAGFPGSLPHFVPPPFLLDPQMMGMPLLGSPIPGLPLRLDLFQQSLLQQLQRGVPPGPPGLFTSAPHLISSALTSAALLHPSAAASLFQSAIAASEDRGNDSPICLVQKAPAESSSSSRPRKKPSTDESSLAESSGHRGHDRRHSIDHHSDMRRSEPQSSRLKDLKQSSADHQSSEKHWLLSEFPSSHQSSESLSMERCKSYSQQSDEGVDLRSTSRTDVSAISRRSESPYGASVVMPPYDLPRTSGDANRNTPQRGYMWTTGSEYADRENSRTPSTSDAGQDCHSTVSEPMAGCRGGDDGVDGLSDGRQSVDGCSLSGVADVDPNAGSSLPRSSIALPPRKRILRNAEELSVHAKEDVGGAPICSESFETKLDASANAAHEKGAEKASERSQSPFAESVDSPSSSLNFRSVWKKFAAKSTPAAPTVGGASLSSTHRSFILSGGKPLHFQKDAAKCGMIGGKPFMLSGKPRGFFQRTALSRATSRFGNKPDAMAAAQQDGSTSPRVTRSQSSRKKKDSPKHSPTDPDAPPPPVRKSMRKKMANSKYDDSELLAAGGKVKKRDSDGSGKSESSVTGGKPSSNKDEKSCDSADAEVSNASKHSTDGSVEAESKPKGKKNKKKGKSVDLEHESEQPCFGLPTTKAIVSSQAADVQTLELVEGSASSAPKASVDDTQSSSSAATNTPTSTCTVTTSSTDLPESKPTVISTSAVAEGLNDVAKSVPPKFRRAKRGFDQVCSSEEALATSVPENVPKSTADAGNSNQIVTAVTVDICRLPERDMQTYKHGSSSNKTTVVKDVGSDVLSVSKSTPSVSPAVEVPSDVDAQVVQAPTAVVVSSDSTKQTIEESVKVVSGQDDSKELKQLRTDDDNVLQLSKHRPDISAASRESPTPWVDQKSTVIVLKMTERVSQEEPVTVEEESKTLQQASIVMSAKDLCKPLESTEVVKRLPDVTPSSGETQKADTSVVCSSTETAVPRSVATSSKSSLRSGSTSEPGVAQETVPSSAVPEDEKQQKSVIDIVSSQASSIADTSVSTASTSSALVQSIRSDTTVIASRPESSEAAQAPAVVTSSALRKSPVTVEVTSSSQLASACIVVTCSATLSSLPAAETAVPAATKSSTVVDVSPLAVSELAAGGKSQPTSVTAVDKPIPSYRMASSLATDASSSRPSALSVTKQKLIEYERQQHLVMSSALIETAKGAAAPQEPARGKKARKQESKPRKGRVRGSKDVGDQNKNSTGSSIPPVLEKSAFVYMKDFSDISDSDDDGEPPSLEATNEEQLAKNSAQALSLDVAKGSAVPGGRGAKAKTASPRQRSAEGSSKRGQQSRSRSRHKSNAATSGDHPEAVVESALKHAVIVSTIASTSTAIPGEAVTTSSRISEPVKGAADILPLVIESTVNVTSCRSLSIVLQKLTNQAGRTSSPVLSSVDQPPVVSVHPSPVVDKLPDSAQKAVPGVTGGSQTEGSSGSALPAGTSDVVSSYQLQALTAPHKRGKRATNKRSASVVDELHTEDADTEPKSKVGRHVDVEPKSKVGRPAKAKTSVLPLALSSVDAKETPASGAVKVKKSRVKSKAPVIADIAEDPAVNLTEPARTSLLADTNDQFAFTEHVVERSSQHSLVRQTTSTNSATAPLTPSPLRKRKPIYCTQPDENPDYSTGLMKCRFVKVGRGSWKTFSEQQAEGEGQEIEELGVPAAATVYRQHKSPPGDGPATVYRRYKSPPRDGSESPEERRTKRKKKGRKGEARTKKHASHLSPVAVPDLKQVGTGRIVGRSRKLSSTVAAVSEPIRFVSREFNIGDIHAGLLRLGYRTLLLDGLDDRYTDDQYSSKGSLDVDRRPSLFSDAELSDDETDSAYKTGIDPSSTFYTRTELEVLMGNLCLDKVARDSVSRAQPDKVKNVRLSAETDRQKAELRTPFKHPAGSVASKFVRGSTQVLHEPVTVRRVQQLTDAVMSCCTSSSVQHSELLARHGASPGSVLLSDDLAEVQLDQLFSDSESRLAADGGSVLLTSSAEQLLGDYDESLVNWVAFGSAEYDLYPTDMLLDKQTDFSLGHLSSTDVVGYGDQNKLSSLYVH